MILFHLLPYGNKTFPAAPLVPQLMTNVKNKHFGNHQATSQQILSVYSKPTFGQRWMLDGTAL